MAGALLPLRPTGPRGDWTRKSVANPDYIYLDAEGYLVLAMALYRGGQQNESRAALAKGIEFIETKLPKLESGDLGIAWNDWLTAQVLLNEAKALIERGETPGK
jgi:hypothetical protein